MRKKMRHPKANPNVRCCWICGGNGGSGFTSALRFAGYEVKPGEMGYAHHLCMTTALRDAERERCKTGTKAKES